MKAYSDECALLMAARMLITDKEAWTQGAYGRDDAGACTMGEEATRWCIGGALVALHPTTTICCAVTDALRTSMGMPPATFNDTHTHKQVLAALDKAIEMSV